MQAGGHGFESRHLHQLLYRAFSSHRFSNKNLQKSPSPVLLLSLPRHQRGEEIVVLFRYSNNKDLLSNFIIPSPYSPSRPSSPLPFIL